MAGRPLRGLVWEHAQRLCESPTFQPKIVLEGWRIWTAEACWFCSTKFIRAEVFEAVLLETVSFVMVKTSLFMAQDRNRHGPKTNHIFGMLRRASL